MFPAKIALEGTMEERLDQLDKRETELMDKVETQSRQIKKLQNEKASLYGKLDDKEWVASLLFYIQFFFATIWCGYITTH